ncbi:MAG: ribosome small subunit-dependent GTPase A [Planctomycetaceae bacterium]|jgi:ribosome biogenesis GTPase|nr:ribosome small subunit-dependent GTPase A [Planctomycetaceae bacterium]
MKKSKIRVEFRKNRLGKTRSGDLTRQYEEHGFQEENSAAEERIGGKSELSRKRTVIGEMSDDTDSNAFSIILHTAAASAVNGLCAGRVLKVHGVDSVVQTEDGRSFHCITRRILKTLATDQRQPVVAGDKVLFRIENEAEGMIERIEPRFGTIARKSRKRRHILVTNVDQMLIVVSAAQPDLKPNLIDRLILTAEQSGVKPVICINKTDLIDAAELQPLAGVFSSMGYKVLQLSVKTGQGIDRLKRLLRNRSSVLAGQSGVGKSSLLNEADSQLHLRIGELGSANKGKHTTTTAELLELSFGGYVVDTPGLRQFMLWDIISEEVFGLFRDLRPYENRCRFPDCTHLNEVDCAVKYAVAEGRLDLRRYESYLSIRFGN